jgi:predicted DNA-binding transcriptional regulator AlpA
MQATFDAKLHVLPVFQVKAHLGAEHRSVPRHIIDLRRQRVCSSHALVGMPDMKRGPENVLPQSLAPRGLSREQAAAYVGISPSLFDMLVKDRRMPAPKRINARTVWDRVQVDEAFAALPSSETSVNPWDEIAA